MDINGSSGTSMMGLSAVRASSSWRTTVTRLLVTRSGRGGAASWRGAVYFFSASPHFAQLNPIAVLFEFEIGDNARDMEIKYYEWK